MEFCEAEWLGQESVGFSRDESPCGRGKHGTGHEDDLCARAYFFCTSEHSDPIDSGHIEISDDEVKRSLMEQVESLLPPESSDDVMARILQRDRQSAQDMGFIIHKKYLQKYPV